MNVGVIAEQELEPISVPIRFECCGAVKIYEKHLKTQIAMFTPTSCEHIVLQPPISGRGSRIKLVKLAFICFLHNMECQLFNICIAVLLRLQPILLLSIDQNKNCI